MGLLEEGVVISCRGRGVQEIQEVTRSKIVSVVCSSSRVDPFFWCHSIIDVEGARVDLQIQCHQITHMTSHVTVRRWEGWVKTISTTGSNKNQNINV